MDRDGDYDTLLSTNDRLESIWTGPQGSIWATSSDGNVWTTAAVAWPPPRVEWLDYESFDPAYPWKIAPLPPHAADGTRPHAGSLWGSSDHDVHVTCFGGSIYHWDGIHWTERSATPDSDTELIAIHGNSPDNIYTVGEGLLAHFDGATWTPLPLPDDAEDETFTGVRVLDGGHVVVCGRGGSILHGGAGGFELLAHYPTGFYGISVAGQQVILSAGNNGAWELVGNRASQVKQQPMVGGFDGGSDLALFVEPGNEKEPSLIEYAPNLTPDWWRRWFPPFD